MTENQENTNRPRKAYNSFQLYSEKNRALQEAQRNLAQTYSKMAIASQSVPSVRWSIPSAFSQTALQIPDSLHRFQDAFRPAFEFQRRLLESMNLLAVRARTFQDLANSDLLKNISSSTRQVQVVLNSFSPFADKLRTISESPLVKSAAMLQERMNQISRQQSDSIHSISKMIQRYADTSSAIQQTFGSLNIEAAGLSLTDADTQELNALAEEILCGESGLAQEISKDQFDPVAWMSLIKDHIPERLRIFIIWFLSIYLSFAVKQVLEGTWLDPRGWMHGKDEAQIKYVINQIQKNEINMTLNVFTSPNPTVGIVRRADLPVHKSPSRKSNVIESLPGLACVEVVDFRKKKRWVNIKWTDLMGQVHEGWVLGRYVTRLGQTRPISEEGGQG